MSIFNTGEALKRFALSIALPGCLILGATAHAHASDIEEAYQRASTLSSHDHFGVFKNLSVDPRWLSDNEFWYTRDGADGKEWVYVDVRKASKRPLFDSKKLASELIKAGGKAIDASDLPIQGVQVLGTAPFKITFTWKENLWEYSAAGLKKTGKEEPFKLQVSPNGKQGAFLKDNNLWVRDTASGKDKQLTTDGEQYYAYARIPDAMMMPPGKPDVIWSADSKRILTVQTDDRQVKELPMIDFVPADGSVRPKAWSRRTALPGDANVTSFRMVSIDVDSGKQVEAQYRHIPAVRMNDTPIGGGWAWWGTADMAYFVDVERGEKAARVIEFDTRTGKTRVVLEESSPSYVELGSNVYMPAALVPLPATQELVWYSERSGWAHLYLYDQVTGKLKRQLTSGDWLVRDVLGVKPGTRELFISIAGMDPAKDPYYRSIAKVNLDTGKLTVLSESDQDHRSLSKGEMGLLILKGSGEDITQARGLSPNGEYFVETVASMESLPKSYLRKADGAPVMTLEEGTTPGVPTGWQAPERVRLTAADGKTVISGAVFRPSNFSDKKSYPVIDYVYGGPQVSFAPKSLNDFSTGMATSLAELGFIVVMIDGRGTTERSREFHESSYGSAHLASNLEDHIAGIKQLAEKYPYIDSSRVGIHGFSGGGYLTAVAMLRYPEFYKVGVAGAGNYDQRLFWHTWGERYQGLADNVDYKPQAALTYAENLQGKLLFIHGLADYGVHPGGLFQLTQALMDANKKFDLVLLPKVGHDIDGYATVRLWDYFVANLAGETPPPNFSTKSPSERMKEKMKAQEDAGEKTAH